MVTTEVSAGVTPLEQLLPRPRRLRGVLAAFGPAFVAAIAYVDPGNFSTNFTAGAHYGYRLLWVVLLANLMAMPVQFLSAKVGIVTGRSLPELCRDRYPLPVRIILWIQAELVAIATDLAEFVGAAIGLNLLFGMAPLTAGIVTAAASFAVLSLQRRGHRPFERAIFFLLLLIAAGFVYQALHVGGDAPAMVGSLVPSFGGPDSVYLSAGIVGATMMPHVVYLHSAMTSHRDRPMDQRGIVRSLRLERWDVVAALGLAGLVNLSMVVIAAQAFHGSGSVADTLQHIHAGLGRQIGGGTALAFAVALLASGVSSSGVGTFAGQAIMAGFLDLHLPLVLRRCLTMAPALVVLALHIDATTVLNLSQVLLSFGIPFALIPLMLLSGNREVMGRFANSTATKVGLGCIVALVVALNTFLLMQNLLP